jgi:hypothetical protein
VQSLAIPGKPLKTIQLRKNATDQPIQRFDYFIKREFGAFVQQYQPEEESLHGSANRSGQKVPTH